MYVIVCSEANYMIASIMSHLFIATSRSKRCDKILNVDWSVLNWHVQIVIVTGGGGQEHERKRDSKQFI